MPAGGSDLAVNRWRPFSCPAPEAKRALGAAGSQGPPSFRLRTLLGSCNFLSALETQKSSALFQAEHFPLFQDASRQQRPSRQPLAPFFISGPRSKKGAGCRRKPRPPSFRPRTLLGSCNLLSALEPQKSSALFQTERFPLFQSASRRR